MVRRYLHLASNRLFWKVGDAYVYPWSVGVSVVPLPAKVSVGEGVAHSAVGAVLSVEELLSDEWAHYIENAEATWLLPYLQRILEGGHVTERELIQHFFGLHGRRPEITHSSYV
ncbi:hypothetical protein ASG90_18785 [Nocardioides sp. Soil797]|nr:hypothetical protein ASG90_18785 [Nocardioides sp. Soil797]